MARIKLQTEEINNPIIQDIFAEIIERAGRVPAAYRAFGRHAHILQANWNRTKNILGQGNLPLVLKESIATRVSAANECHFCLHIHKGNLEKLGVSLPEISHIEKGISDDKQLHFVLQFVTTATKKPALLTDQDFDTLRSFGYTDEDILEILTVMEMYTGYNKIIVALDLKLDD